MFPGRVEVRTMVGHVNHVNIVNHVVQITQDSLASLVSDSLAELMETL